MGGVVIGGSVVRVGLGFVCASWHHIAFCFCGGEVEVCVSRYLLFAPFFDAGGGVAAQASVKSVHRMIGPGVFSSSGETRLQTFC
jgi:hypothetical protein